MEAGSKDERVGEESERETQEWRRLWFREGYGLRGVGVVSSEVSIGEDAVKRDWSRRCGFMDKIAEIFSGLYITEGPRTEGLELTLDERVVVPSLEATDPPILNDKGVFFDGDL